MSPPNPVKSYLTPKEVAELLMVSTAAVRLWTANSDLKASVTAGGHRRFKMEDVKQFALQRNIQLNTPTINTLTSKTPKVLIVDDDSNYAKFLETVLKIEIENIQVETSLDGFDAANKLREFSPSIVLLDLKMPGLDSYEVCQHIKQNPHYKHVRVFGISGDASNENIAKIKSAGAEECLSKPINVYTLINYLTATSPI